MIPITNVPTSRDETAKLADIDPDFAALLPTLPPAPTPDWTNFAQARALNASIIAAGVANLPPLPSTVTSSTLPIPHPHGTLTAHHYHPTTPPAGGSPLVVLFFGGGWIMGNPAQHTAQARGFAELFGASVILPDYRLAPENPFPAAPEDAWRSTVWTVKHAEELGADVSKGLIVAGQSAGGNLAASVVTRAATEEGAKELGAKITGQWLNIPAVMSAENVPERFRDVFFSEEQTKDVEFLDGTTLQAMLEAYNPDKKSPLWSPLNHGEDVLRKLPKTYFQVMGRDPLRDHGLIYERVLRELGVETKTDLYPGLVHGSSGYFHTLKSSKTYGIDSARGVGWLLGMDVDEEKVAVMQYVAGSG